MNDWLFQGWDILWHAAFTALVLIIVMVIFVRLNGLRSLAKMSSIDFVTTITIGSVMSSAIMTNSASLAKGVVVVGFLLTVQTVFSSLKIKSKWFSKVTENKPVLLMRDGEFIEKNLKSTNVPKSDVIAKLRSANALELKHVHAVVLETTGDISVLQGDKDSKLDPILLDNVQG